MTITLPTPTKSKVRRTITAVGDSLTDNTSLGNFGTEFWPSHLERYLNSTEPITDGIAIQASIGCNCKVRNFGYSGSTSGPFAQGTASGLVTDTTHVTLSSVVGTFKAGQTVLINGSMAQINTYSGGIATLYTALPAGMVGNSYSTIGMSDYQYDLLGRVHHILGAKTPRALDMLCQTGAPEWDPPDILAVWIGVNDPGRSISGNNLSTTIKTAPSLSAAQWPQPAAGGTTQIPLQTGQGATAVVGQAAVIVDWTQTPARVWVGLITSVSGDTISVSGNFHALQQSTSNWNNWYAQGANPLPGPVPPVGAAVYQGTQGNIIGLCLLTQLYGGTSKFIVGNTQYKNFSVGGDTLATPEATYATLRPFQAAAVTALQAQGVSAVLADIYTYMRNRIVNGDTYAYRASMYMGVQGDNAWHSATNNQHLNPLGESMVAMAFLGAIESQAGWMDSLNV